MQRKSVAIIQARMGSTRMPGKVMLPLGDCFGLENLVNRVDSASEVDKLVVATSRKRADDIIEWGGEQFGAEVFRGDENNVLDRIYRAAASVEASEIVRITADCPLLAPSAIDKVLTKFRNTDADYAANILDRTFPRGLDVEAFTMKSLKRVHDSATDPSHLEHVTLYYRENPEMFNMVNVTSEEVFEEEWLRNRIDLRLTLDEAADYRLLYEVFENLEYDLYPSFRDAVRYIDERGIGDLNAHINQKNVDDAAGS